MMPDFTVITGRNFVVKRGAENASRMPLHQDLTFVDQNVERGVHIWIPLVDVNHDNGCLKVAPKSHRLMNHIAAVGSFEIPFEPVREIFEKHCTISVPMKAGAAFFFDERLIHGSDANKMPAVRPAANIAFVRNGTKQRVHFVNPATPGVLDIFEVDHEFAIQYTNALDHHWLDRDAVRKIGTLEYHPVQLTVAELQPMRLRSGEAPVAVSEPASTPIPPPSAKMPTPQSVSFFSRLFGGRL
jgi:ectoine hydroxylase-related dioxygenase (phytanoyl-CoA dioxygenase family)